MADYSISKGLGKGVKGFLLTAVALIIPILLSQIPEGMTLGSIVDKYAVQFLGTASIAGLLTLVTNWIKVKNS